MYKDKVTEWLRNEAESLGKDIEKIENKIIKLMEKRDFNSLDKINQLNTERVKLQASQLKLYEMIGRIFKELDSID